MFHSLKGDFEHKVEVVNHRYEPINDRVDFIKGEVQALERSLGFRIAECMGTQREAMHGDMEARISQKVAEIPLGNMVASEVEKRVLDVLQKNSVPPLPIPVFSEEATRAQIQQSVQTILTSSEFTSHLRGVVQECVLSATPTMSTREGPVRPDNYDKIKKWGRI